MKTLRAFLYDNVVQVVLLKNMKILLVLLFAAASASANTYYIDYASGSDSNSGTSTNTPWKCCPGMSGFAGSYTHSAGDRFIFKGGVTWPSSTLKITFSHGGAAANPDYYGVNTNYFAGSSWMRPILDGGAGTEVAFWLVNYNNIIIDNLEFNNWGMSGGVINAYTSTNISILNCCFHNWSHSGTTDDLKCINGSSYQAYSANNVISNCVFDGSPLGTNSGMAVYHWSGVIKKCVAKNMSNGFLPNSGEVSGCQIGPINVSFDSNQHENAIESLGNGSQYYFNNVIHNTVGVTIFIGNPGGPGYVYNNLIYNSTPVPIQFDGRSGGFNCYVYNNTVVSGTALHNTGGGCYLYATNNHIIGSLVDSSFASVSQGNNLIQTVSQAAATGYSAANNWQPTSTSSPTVDAGADLSVLFNTDINGNIRPQGTAWDIGAYEYPQAVPIINAVFHSGTNLIVSGTNGSPNGYYLVLASTNLLLPRTDWTRLSTNSFNGSGNCIFTNPITPNKPALFYLLQLQ